MTKKVSCFVYWTPRVIAIVFIFFLMLLSLDVLFSELPFIQKIIGLFMHNLPAIVLLIVLIISWKYEIVGGVVFLLAGLYFLVNIVREGLPWHICLIIAGPAFFIGILFMINWFKKK